MHFLICPPSAWWIDNETKLLWILQFVQLWLFEITPKRNIENLQISMQIKVQMLYCVPQKFYKQTKNDRNHQLIDLYNPSYTLSMKLDHKHIIVKETTTYKNILVIWVFCIYIYQWRSWVSGGPVQKNSWGLNMMMTIYCNQTALSFNEFFMTLDHFKLIFRA